TPAASVHPGPTRRAPPSGACARRAARGDPRLAAAPRRDPERLRISSTLPLCHRLVPHRGAGARPRRRPSARLPRRPVPSMSALELQDVVVDYERRGTRIRAVAGASLSVDSGEIVGLVGESGCGKSTLARAAVGLVPIAEGSVKFEGTAVSPLSRRARPRELARLQL